jgi:Fe-S cluster assembly ATP-binding protein
MVWQNPPAVKGVKLSQLLEKVTKGTRTIKERGDLVIGSELLEREVNVNFSGGEKKISELLQISALKPKLLILDEIDSGLDIKKIDMVGKIIKKEFLGNGTAILMITHSGEMMNFLKPSFANIILKGRILCRSNDYKKVLKTIKQYGYEKCKRCR